MTGVRAVQDTALSRTCHLLTHRLERQSRITEKGERMDRDERRVAGSWAWGHALPALFTSSNMGLSAKTQPCYLCVHTNTHTPISLLPSLNNSVIWQVVPTWLLYLYLLFSNEKSHASWQFDSFYCWPIITWTLTKYHVFGIPRKKYSEKEYTGK